MTLSPAGLRVGAALVAAASVGFAQAEVRRVPVTVTAVQLTRAYLDQGSDAGLAIGDRVELHPAGQSMIEAVVRGITRDSARIEWSGVGVLEIGTAGEVLVPAERQTPGAIAHPPWAQGAEQFDPDLPLLAPVQGISNWERERNLRGRWFSQANWSAADINGEQDYLLARSGLDLALDNPFGKGGALEFDGELLHRSQSLWDAGDDSETHARLDRLSTWWGGVRGRETRYEFGRFLHHEFPEFGVLDGGEINWRSAAGHRFGASMGLLPEIDDTRSSGEDVALAAWYRLVVGEDEHAALGLGAQKTWHAGSADRDLLVVQGHWRAGARWSISGSGWIDFYGSEDKLKDSGPELTQAFANANYRFDNGFSLGAHASQFRWPELARDELPPLTSTTLVDGEVTRVGLNASKNLTSRLRLWARADRWSDQDDAGGNYEVRAVLRDTLFDKGEISAAGFVTEGKFSDVQGVRAGVQRNFVAGNARLDYEIAQSDQVDFNGTQASLTQHALRASFDTSFGKAWSLSLSGETRFGDEQDSFAAGFYLQYRF